LPSCPIKTAPIVRQDIRNRYIKSWTASNANQGNGKSDDELLAEIVGAGCAFSTAPRELRNAKEAHGLIVPRGKAAEVADGILKEMEFDPQDWDDVAAAVDALDKVPSPLRQIKRYCRDNKIEMPTRARKLPCKLPFKARAEDWMIKNAKLGSADGFRGWLAGEAKTDKQSK
jgi:hypothetical protein